MGNLKVGEHQDLPIPSFRTDNWDWPESEDPEVSAVGRAEGNEMKEEAIGRCEYRRNEEAKRGRDFRADQDAWATGCRRGQRGSLAY